jgi:hypothetical protein
MVNIMKNWHGLMKVLKVEHIRNNKVIWQNENILNMFHTEGEQHILRCAFDSTTSVPSFYYFGLDNREEILASDVLTDLVEEPTVNGYARAAINTNGQFNFEKVNGVWRAVSPIFSFSAIGGSWGPVTTFFMATTLNNTGHLIASAYLSSAITLVEGDSVNLRMGLSLQDG